MSQRVIGTAALLWLCVTFAQAEPITVMAATKTETAILRQKATLEILILNLRKF